MQVAHYRIGNGAAPHFEGIKSGFFKIGQNPVDLLLVHTGCKKRLLSIAKGYVSDKNLFFHKNLLYLLLLLTSVIK